MKSNKACFAIAFIWCASLPASAQITGSGTAGYMARFTGPKIVANSRIFQNASGIGINTASPTTTLDVNGNINLFGSLRFSGRPALVVDSHANVALGFGTLQANTGQNNTAIGNNALHDNTTASYNTAIGNYALGTNTIGVYNTASGFFALMSNTTGLENTANGAQALQKNSTGGGNTANGGRALFANSTGNSNTAGGFGAMQSNTTGGGNTAYGVGALSNNNTGNNNIAIGDSAGLNISGSNSNNIIIGSDGIASDDATIRVGTVGRQSTFFAAGIRGVLTTNNDALPVVIDSNGQLGTLSSSLRYKQNIEDVGDSSRVLMRLRPVKFHYKGHPVDRFEYGLIAEEVAEVLPDAVVYSQLGQPEAVQYDKVNAMLLNEFQKQQRRIQDLESSLTRLESSLAEAHSCQQPPSLNNR